MSFFWEFVYSFLLSFQIFTVKLYSIWGMSLCVSLALCLLCFLLIGLFRMLTVLKTCWFCGLCFFFSFLFLIIYLKGGVKERERLIIYPLLHSWNGRSSQDGPGKARSQELWVRRGSDTDIGTWIVFCYFPTPCIIPWSLLEMQHLELEPALIWDAHISDGLTNCGTMPASLLLLFFNNESL